MKPKFFLNLGFCLILLLFSYPSHSSEQNLKQGYEAFLAKDYTRASNILSTASLSATHPLEDYLLWSRGKSRIETGDFEKGFLDLQQLVQNHPDSLWIADAKVAIARGLQAKQDPAGALAFLNIELESLPESKKADAYYIRAIAHLQTGDEKKALADFKTAYLQYPNAEIDWKIENDLKLRKPDLLESITPLERWERSQKLYQTKRYSEVLKNLEILLSSQTSVAALSDTQRTSIQILKGESLYALKRFSDASTALSIAQTASASAEILRLALLHLGISYQKSGQPALANKAFERVHQFYPESIEGEEALYRIAQSALDTNRLEEALQGFKKLEGAYPHGNFRDKGLWAMGWNRYRHADYKTAGDLFASMEKGAVDSPTRGKAAYWRTRTLEKSGSISKIQTEWLRASQLSPFTYYGFMSLKNAKGSKNLSETPPLPAEWKLPKSIGNPIPAPTSEVSLKSTHLKKAQTLARIGLGKQSFAEIQRSVEDAKKSPSELYLILEIAHRSDTYFLPVVLTQPRLWSNFKPLFKTEKEAEDARNLLQFPFAYENLIRNHAKSSGVSPHLVVALMRQESSFQPWVISSANAKGLMQLLPSTADGRARAIGFQLSDLLDPEENIRVGVAELAAMLKRFSDNWIHAIAAYNAGPGRPPQWVAQFGNLEPDEFVEEIPFGETNLYVKLVLRNYWVYRSLY